ncbi:sugar transferase [Turicibacter sp. TJ11]|uniref:sugar transferase n=1 Tax=Turicibacter sp. TJ11 TaxID=2806443 RepID=UPI001F416022|nr:sugar transferase [Turicibacter sp. TJ11]
MYHKYFKRVLDIIISLGAIIILSPVIIIVSALVRLKLGNPVIFKQKRPGKDCKIFTMYKFRTMTDEKDGNGELLPDDIRLTKFGKWLRSTSLDELPELWNVLKGDMSLVGPRPQLVRDMVFFDTNQIKRQEVLPGLTGLAQVSGRNSISWEQKLNYDLDYIKKITFVGDFKIILSTISKVFFRENIHADGMQTAEDFGDYLIRTQKIDKKTYDVKISLSKKLLSK